MQKCVCVVFVEVSNPPKSSFSVVVVVVISRVETVTLPSPREGQTRGMNEQKVVLMQAKAEEEEDPNAEGKNTR